MANELNIDLTPARTGYTMTVQLLLNGVLFGSPIAATEPSPGYYTATMSAPAGGYAVRFIVDGTTTIGTGFIAWDGTSEVNIANLPTLTQLEARTLPSADYFNPATDPVATVTTVTNAVTLPSIPVNWITAAGVAADAVAEIQAGLATASAVAAIPTNPLLASAYVAPLTTLQTTGAVNDALVTYAAAKALPAIR